MNLHFENPYVIMVILALLSVAAACLFTLYLRNERRGRRTRGGSLQRGPTFIRLSDYRRDARRRNRPAA